MANEIAGQDLLNPTKKKDKRQFKSVPKQRPDSNLELKEKYRSFGEYAEHVAPDMYDHKKI